MTWHEIMTYAHQGIELKNIPGLPPNPTTTAPAIADASAKGEAPHPIALTNRGTQILLQVERMMEEATRGLVAARNPPPPGLRPGASIDQPNTLASASERRGVSVRRD
jgi:penicillin-binding protein 1A